MTDSLRIAADSLADAAGRYSTATVDSLVGRINWERIALASQEWFKIGCHVKAWLP